MNRRLSTPEPMLPLDLTQPIRGTQVSPHVHDAAIALRKRGHAVYSIAERQHKVDGRIVSTAQLLELAEAVSA